MFIRCSMLLRLCRANSKTTLVIMISLCDSLIRYKIIEFDSLSRENFIFKFEQKPADAIYSTDERIATQQVMP